MLAPLLVSENKLTQRSIFISKANTKHKNKYTYRNVKYLNNTQYVLVTCKTHGDFSISPVRHLQGTGCPVCRTERVYVGHNVVSKRERKKTFIAKGKETHKNRFKYNKVKYVDRRTPVIIVCPEHGEFEQSPQSHLNTKHCCPVCSYKAVQDNIKRTSHSFRKKYNI